MPGRDPGGWIPGSSMARVFDTDYKAAFVCFTLVDSALAAPPFEAGRPTGQVRANS